MRNRTLLHDAAALPPPIEWEEVRCCHRLLHRPRHQHSSRDHHHAQVVDTICDFCADLCVFVGKRFTTRSSSSISSSISTETEVIMGICLTPVDCGVHANVDVVSRDLDFPSSSWRRYLTHETATSLLQIENLLNPSPLVSYKKTKNHEPNPHSTLKLVSSGFCSRPTRRCQCHRRSSTSC